jgi:hypothetical protein
MRPQVLSSLTIMYTPISMGLGAKNNNNMQKEWGQE